MLIPQILISLFIALALTLIFGVGFSRQRGFNAVLLFFLIIFLATWAGGLWLPEFGPAIWGVAWMTFLIVGAIFAFLVTALTSAASPYRPPQLDNPHAASAERGDRIAINIFLWILLAGLLIVILTR